MEVLGDVDSARAVLAVCKLNPEANIENPIHKSHKINLYVSRKIEISDAVELRNC